MPIFALSITYKILGTWTPFNPETIRLMMGKANYLYLMESH